MSCCVYMFQRIYVKRGSIPVMASRDTASSYSLLLCALSSRSLRKIFIYTRHVDAKGVEYIMLHYFYIAPYFSLHDSRLRLPLLL